MEPHPTHWPFTHQQRISQTQAVTGHPEWGAGKHTRREALEVITPNESITEQGKLRWSKWGTWMCWWGGGCVKWLEVKGLSQGSRLLRRTHTHTHQTSSPPIIVWINRLFPMLRLLPSSCKCMGFQQDNLFYNSAYQLLLAVMLLFHVNTTERLVR